jgi:hypothetical protein
MFVECKQWIAGKPDKIKPRTKTSRRQGKRLIS